MSFLRNLWADLVDRRLWPVAAVLLVALVAVPVVLSKSSPSSTGPIAADAQPRASLPGGTVVSIKNGAQGALRTGQVKDPFKQQHVPRPSSSSAVAAGGLGPAQPSSTSFAGTGTSGGSVTLPSVPSSEPAAQPTLKVELRFGRTGAGLTKSTLAPRTALPSIQNPLLIYLGVLADGKTASFLVSSDASPQGDGRCSPSRRACVTVHMKAGQIEFFDVGTGAGAVQYRLDLLRIFKG